MNIKNIEVSEDVASVLRSHAAWYYAQIGRFKNLDFGVLHPRTFHHNKTALTEHGQNWGSWPVGYYELPHSCGFMKIAAHRPSYREIMDFDVKITREYTIERPRIARVSRGFYRPENEQL